MILDRFKPGNLGLETSEEDRETAIVLLTATVLIVMFAYWGRPGFFFTSGLVGWFSDRASGVLGEDVAVGGYLWWGLASLFFRVVVPLGVVVLWLKRSPGEFGFRVRGTLRHLPVYVGLYVVMLPLLIWASSLDSFLGFYPFYDRAIEGGAAFWLYELGYGIQFIGVEAFFRGFLTFGLARRFGLLGVVFMTVPYTMIHLTKPMPEAFAAIVAGLLLGYLALRSRSFVPGIYLHAGIALTMDLLVITRVGALGNIF